MARFIIHHQHEPGRCPARSPELGALLLNHLSHPNLRRHGIELVAEAVTGNHELYAILDARDAAAVRAFMQPFDALGGVRVQAASSCVRVVASGGCDQVHAPEPAAHTLDPEEACQRAIDAGLVVHRAHPLNCETSIAALIASGAMPNAHFYVRNHFGVPLLDADSFRLQVGGLVDRPRSFSLRDLDRMPSQSLTVTLECAGNGRAFLDPPAPGEQWRWGAVSTAEWTGVPLFEILERVGLQAGAREVLFRGADAGRVADRAGDVPFERSLALEQALGPEVLLAYAMNGEPLPIQHGYPLRLVVPGYYGVASVKWLTHIDVVERPFTGFFQTDRYVIEHQEDGHIGKEPLTLQRVRALITEPAEGEPVERGELFVRGVAWSGAAGIARVDVSVDGAPWQQARLLGEHRLHGFRSWELPVSADPGSLNLRVRATDLAGRTQPEQPEWNRLGYANNAIQSIAVQVT